MRTRSSVSGRPLHSSPTHARRTGDVAPESSRPRFRDYLIAAPVAGAGTVNLWKLESLRSFVPVDLTLATMAPVGGLVLLVLVVSPQRLRSVFPMLILVASFLPGLALSSLNQPYAIQKCLQLFIFVPVLVAGGLLLVDDPRRQRAFRHTLIALGIAIAVGIEFGGTVVAEGSERVGLEDGNTIALARLCALAVVSLLVSAPLKRPRLPALLASALCLHAIFMTGSRGPLIAGLLGIAVAVVLAAPVGPGSDVREWERRLLTRVLPLAAGIAVGWTLIQHSRLITAFGGESDEVRVQLLGESLRLWLANPLGLGWGDFVLHMELGLRNDLQGWAQYPHNILAEALVEGGPVALLGLLYLSWLALRGLWKAAQDGNPPMLALFVTTYGSALTSSDLTSNRALWVLLGVGLAAFASHHDQQESTDLHHNRRVRIAMHQ